MLYGEYVVWSALARNKQAHGCPMSTVKHQAEGCGRNMRHKNPCKRLSHRDFQRSKNNHVPSRNECNVFQGARGGGWTRMAVVCCCLYRFLGVAGLVISSARAPTCLSHSLSYTHVCKIPFGWNRTWEFRRILHLNSGSMTVTPVLRHSISLHWVPVTIYPV